MNGGTKKALVGLASTMLGSGILYIAHEVNKVEPLQTQVQAIDRKVDGAAALQAERKEDQKSWNEIFLDNQRRSETKIDEALQLLRAQK